MMNFNGNNMKKVVFLLLILLMVSGCSKLRSAKDGLSERRVAHDTYRLENGSYESWALAAEKPKAEKVAMKYARQYCRDKNSELVLISKDTIYQGKLTGKM